MRVFLALLGLIALCQASIVWPTDDEEEMGPSNRHGSYIVVAPKTLRPGLPYSLSVNLLPRGLATRKLDVRENVVEVELRNGQGIPKAIQWVENVKPGEPTTLLFPPEETARLKTEYHRVHVRAETKAGVVIFEGNQGVRVEGKPLTPFVQTDKAAYKPENTVRFRTLLVNPQLLPHEGQISVKVKDPKNNVIKLYNSSLSQGVLSRQFNLSSQPPLGNWRIEVSDEAAGGEQLMTKTFSVEKYVLPKFEVKLEAAEFTQIPEPLEIKVVAKYTYGKGINGKVKVFPVVRSSSPAGQIEKVAVLENGEATVTFTFEELFRRNLLDMYRSASTFSLAFTANVTEDLTNIVRSARGSATLYKHGVQISFASPTDNFKPGLNYDHTISVKNPDGSVINPTWNRRLNLSIDFRFPNQSVKTTETFVQLDQGGRAKQTIPTLLNSTNMDIKAYYHRRAGAGTYEFHSSRTVQGMKSGSGNFLQLKVQGSGKFKPGETAEVALEATESIASVQAQVLSRGYVVWGSEIPLGGRSGSISIPITTEMSPKARLVVFAVREDQSREVLVDVVEFAVDGFFRNNVTLEFSQSRTTPGAEKAVTLRARAEPGSLVCLMAVDKSVELLRGGFDVTGKDVESAITRYSSGRAGGQHAKDVFDNAALNILTDGLVFDGRPPPPPIRFPMPIDQQRIFVSEPAPRAFAAAGFGGGGGGGGGGGPPPPPGAPPPPMEISAPMYSFEEAEAEEEPDFDDDSDRSDSPALLKKDVEGRRGRPRGGKAKSAKAVKARSNFPETWIWTEEKTDSDGIVSHSAPVPDTITSWVASALALHDEAGLGVAADRARLEVFKPFFVSLNLPYSVKRQEKVGLQVLVFNYDDTDAVVEVTLGYNATGNNSFDFLDAEGNVMAVKPRDTDPESGDFFDNRNRRRVTVPKGGASTVWFPIQASQVGRSLLHVTAIAEGKIDVLKRYLRVEPEGFPVEKTLAELISLEEDSGDAARSLVMEFPAATIPGSQFAQLSVIGDTMGPALQNPEGLIRMPYGCGEQNLVNFVPTIVVRRYLEVIERLTPAAEAKAQKSLESGYQRQLSYMRGDGSFSAFGDSDRYGSTWLTAFVVKSFDQAKPFIFVDSDVIGRSCRYLDQRVRNRSPGGRGADDGSVEELGSVHNRALKGGENSQVGLSAFVLIALNRCPSAQSQERARNVRAFVERSLDSIRNNSYALAIAAYALQLSNSSRADEAFAALDARGVSSGGERSWNYTKPGAPMRPWYWYRPSSLDVEATSYALLVYLARGREVDAAPIARWLIRQQNPYGGYASTQDTVMAVQALGAFAERTYSRGTQMEVSMRVGSKTFPAITVEEANAIVLQQQEIKNFAAVGAPTQVEIGLAGKGKAFLGLGYSYHLNPELGEQEPFECEVRPQAEGKGRLSLVVECGFTNGTSNMAVVEVDALSGWVFDEEALEALKGQPNVKRTELEKGGTHANIYFDSLSDARKEKVALVLEQEMTVAEQKPARLVVYDYYDPEIRSELQYTQAANPTLQEACPECWSNIPTIV